MNKEKIIIKKAKFVVTCDENNRIHSDIDVFIEGKCIKKIGQVSDVEDALVIDGKNKVVYPGLINTHHHFFQTFIRNLIKVDYVNLNVLDWLDIIYKICPYVNESVIYHSALTAMADLIKHGCTTAFDHQYCNPKYGKYIDQQMAAAQLLGIRFHGGRGANSISQKNGSPVPEILTESADEFLSDCDRLISKFHDSEKFSMRQIVVAPCQPINMYESDFIASIDFARKKGVRLHTHLGEGENEVMVERYGKRSLEWCEKIGFIGDDVWFAHGWELLPEEYAVLGQTKTGLSHCPGPAVLGGYPIIDIKGMQKENVIIGLGCDGSATNDSSSMLDTLRVAYMMQAYFSKNREGCATPYDILKCATQGGAKLLGRSDIGFLEEGMAADLFMIDLDVLEHCGIAHDPGNMLARVGITGTVWLTMINGKIVWHNNKLTNVDEKLLRTQSEGVYETVLRKPFKDLYSYK